MFYDLPNACRCFPMPSHPIVTFSRDANNHLRVSISTERLYLESVNENHTSALIKLFGDSTNSLMLYDGKPCPESTVRTQLREWIDLWENNVPFSAFAVSRLEDVDSELVGCAMLSSAVQHNPDEITLDGAAELGVAIDRMHWSMGYGREVAIALTHAYVPEILRRPYMLNGAPLTSVIAITNTDNAPAISLIKAVGMKQEGVPRILYGHSHCTYRIGVEEILKK